MHAIIWIVAQTTLPTTMPDVTTAISADAIASIGAIIVAVWQIIGVIKPLLTKSPSLQRLPVAVYAVALSLLGTAIGVYGTHTISGSPSALLFVTLISALGSAGFHVNSNVISLFSQSMRSSQANELSQAATDATKSAGIKP